MVPVTRRTILRAILATAGGVTASAPGAPAQATTSRAKITQQTLAPTDSR